MAEKKIIATIAILACALLLAAGAITIIVAISLANDDGNDPSGGGPSIVTNEKLSTEAYSAWMDYKDESIPEPNTDLMYEENLTTDLELVPELVGQEEFVTSKEEGTGGGNGSYGGDSDGAGGGAGAAEDSNSDKDSGGEEREVEEADIVKVVDDRMFILNPYRGLIITDISTPDESEIISRVGVNGYPVEMYVVDYLVFVILNTNYRYWYYYDMYAEDGDDAEFTIGSQLVVINVYDEENPYIAKKFDLNGFSSDSRRVGDVIYCVTNTYNWYYYRAYMESNDATYIVSVDLEDPTQVGIKDKVTFDGASNEIHVTPDTIYVGSSEYDYTWWENQWEEEEEVWFDGGDGNGTDIEEPKAATGSSGGSSSSEEEEEDEDDLDEYDTDDTYYYMTEVTYVDISDPDGDIEVKDKITMPGHLTDRYQMDYYDETFRIVTHFYEGLGSSQLWIWDVKDSDDIEIKGRLMIDDAGSLMATRFAGERGYTIHLPRAIDPLDVLDLSDPSDPKLCDVFEMPGWVTHMHVIGYKIVALGVDDSEGQRNIAVSLFDVTDPYKVVMEDRVRIGGDYAWSEANWDPKAFTIVEEENIVMVPFSSYGDDYEMSYGFQIVEYDLKKDDLEDKGAINGIDQITRTRYKDGYILATSDSTLQVVDASDLDEPEIVTTVELSANIVDSIFNGDVNVQLVRNWQEEVLRLRTCAEEDYDLGTKLDEVQIDADWGYLYVDGDLVVLYGYTYDNNWDKYDYTSWYDRYEGFVAAYSVDSEGKLTSIGEWNTGQGHRISSFWPMGDDHFLVIDQNYNYYDDDGYDLWVVKIDTTITEVSEMGLDVDMMNAAVFADGILFFSDYEYEYWKEKVEYEDEYYGGTYYYWQYHYNYTYYLNRIDFTDKANPSALTKINIPGELVGVNDEGSHIYCKSDWHDDDEHQTYLYSTLDTLLIDSANDKCRIQSSIKLESQWVDITIVDDVAYIKESYYDYWWYYDGYGMYGRSMPYYYGYESEYSMLIIDLSNPSVPKLIANVELQGSFSTLGMSEDMIILYDSSSLSVLVLSIDNGGIENIGGYSVPGYVRLARVSNGYIDLIMGQYGIYRLVLSGGPQ